MSRVQKLRVFVSQRLNAAVEEILAAFEKTIVKYEQEAALCQEIISRQHALLCALHKPSADAFNQQLLVSKEVHSERDQDQEDPQPSHVEEEQEGEQLQNLDEVEIIKFTYNPRRAVRPGEDLDLSAAGSAQVEPGPADLVQDILLVSSSETEDSDDYSRHSADPRPASDRPKPKTNRRPGAISCRVCSRTFRAQRFLFRHVKAHLQEVEPVCGVCGERFETTDGLGLHVQTHRIGRKRGDPENETRTRSRERLIHQHSNLDTKDHEDQNPNRCDDCGKTFLQVWKKKKHRCCPRRKNQDPKSPRDGPKRRRRRKT
ncbi:zinc finger protein 691-like [Lates japonicus]|uniref:Zinc finger protein 691-like protein n=1 Tax=Lates japonicus TaxID=270547 RepID=A0AAD3RI35_LATJO|nr:zinc finger protein 691-like protein [Lates japonicus]